MEIEANAHIAVGLKLEFREVAGKAEAGRDGYYIQRFKDLKI
jgi:hypothetical protein